jgi:uncharacterized membrane protein
MNWKLIFQLSLFGLAMAFATVTWIPSNIEPIFWLAIFIICAYLIATKCSAKSFLHGFLVSIFNSIWITTVHVMFFDTYMANHPDMTQMNASLPMPDSPRLMMVMMGPLFGAAFGLILGLFAFLASKIIKKPTP